MNEEPKNTRKGTRHNWFRAWWISLVAVFVVVTVSSGFTGHLLVPDWPRILLFYLIGSAIVGAVFASLWFLAAKNSEKPESLWNKPRTGWAWLWAWLVLVLATFFIVLIIGLFLGGAQNAGAALGISAAVSVLASVFVGLLAFIHWLCSWKNFRRFLFGLACFATLIALFYAEEDWRGWHDWNQFKRQWEAKGEKFGWQSVVPPPVPDDQNFAFSPVWMAEIRYDFRNAPKQAEAWYGDRIYSDAVSRLMPLMPVPESALVGTNWWHEHLPNEPDGPGNWATAHMPDLKPWQTYYRDLEQSNPAAKIPVAPQPQSPAQDVLLALSKFDPVIEQLRADSARPYSRFPIGYDDENKFMFLLPHLAAVKRYSQVLQLRAIAELQDGQTDKALADVKLSLRLVDSIRTEPFLISHLVRLAMLQIIIQPIYEGLANHQWSDAQLTELDAELAKLDFVADYGVAMHGEMGMQDGLFDWLRHHPNDLYNLSGNFGGERQLPLPGRMLVHLIPSGWFYQNQLHCARPMTELILPVAEVSQQTISPSKVKKADAAIQAETSRVNAFNFMERLMLSTLGSTARRFAYAQAAVDLARTAIALERYRLTHGGYHGSLDALAPQFIAKVPHDVIGGGPLHYRLTGDGQFVLYSIGWNERDDGGVVVFGKGSKPAVDINQGDWVWRYPAK